MLSPILFQGDVFYLLVHYEYNKYKKVNSFYCLSHLVVF